MPFEGKFVDLVALGLNSTGTPIRRPHFPSVHFDVEAASIQGKFGAGPDALGDDAARNP